MILGAWIQSKKFFYAIIALYLLLGLFNLSYIPIPWLDEAACLDPAIQWHKTGHYVSRAWATPGSDRIFLSYPPLIVVLHILNLYVFPLKVFWVRLPFLLLHVSAVVLLFNILIRYIRLPIFAATFCTFLFLFDKAVFEISRAVRSETIEIFLLGILVVLFYKKSRPIFIGLVCGLLLIAHLKEWPLVGTFGIIYLLFYVKGWKRIEFIVPTLLPLLAFLFFIHFDIKELYSQMVVYSSIHTAQGNAFSRISSYFFTKFFPIYREQPWMPFLHLWICIIAIKQIIRDYKKHIWAVVFIATTLSWIFVLSPNYRYWTALYFMGILILGEWISTYNFTPKWYIIPFYILLSFPFFSRHALGLLQRRERDPERALGFLKAHIPTDKKTLVFGDEIALYMTGNYANMDCGHAIEPDNFHFRDYETVYYVTHENFTSLTLLSTYHINNSLKLPDWAYKLGKGGTFEGMKIYLVPSEKEWKQVTKNFYP